MDRNSDLQDVIQRVLNQDARVKTLRAAAGGSINDAFTVELDDGRHLFIKTHRGQKIPGMYPAEARALALLAAPATLAVPQCLHADADYLVLEAFREGPPAADWQEQMGRGLALLQQATRQSRFGFDCDNYLGTTPQPNAWSQDWIGFWREQRLGHQLALFRPRASKDESLLKAGDRLLSKLDEILACDPEPAVLLHGDLWSGNAAANEQGEPVIFDPASYYGHREAEIGMMRLFGGFGPSCEAAYGEVWPFQPGFERRIEVYRLYHQLNHLNLFGGGYYGGCLATIEGLL